MMDEEQTPPPQPKRAISPDVLEEWRITDAGLVWREVDRQTGTPAREVSRVVYFGIAGESVGIGKEAERQILAALETFPEAKVEVVSRDSSKPPVARRALGLSGLLRENDDFKARANIVVGGRLMEGNSAGASLFYVGRGWSVESGGWLRGMEFSDRDAIVTVGSSEGVEEVLRGKEFAGRPMKNLVASDVTLWTRKK